MNRSSKIIGCLSLLFILSMPLSALDTKPFRYMILMNDQFASNELLKNFIYWKKVKGNNVVQVKTSEIPAVAPGAPTSKEIETFMQTLSADKYPTYLLIIGDSDRVNGVEGRYIKTSAGGYTDLYYACRDQADYIPEIFYGRLPAANNDSLTLMLQRVLAMDRNPPASNMYNKVVAAAKLQGNSIKEENGYTETIDAIASYFEQDILHKGYICSRIISDEIMGDPSLTEWDPAGILWNAGTKIGPRVLDNMGTCANISDSVNAGIALLVHRDHGVVDGFESPEYSTPDVQNLTNGENRPLVLSINCSTGAYHKQNNFAQAWMIAHNGGAYGVIAAVDVSDSWGNNWMTHGMFIGLLPNYIAMHNNSTNPDWGKSLPDASPLAEGQAFRLGPMLTFGKMYMHNHYPVPAALDESQFQLFHVFGDPEMEVRLHTPQPITPFYPSSVPIGTTSLTVNAGAAGLQVCILGAGYTPEQQTAVTTGNSFVFTIATPTTGLIHTTITGLDRRPHEGVIRVGSGLVFGSNKMLIGTDGNAHVSGYQTTSAQSGLQFGSSVTVSTDQGNLQRNSVRANYGSWFDTPGNLTGGLVFRGPDGKAHMHVGANGVVTVRNRFNSM